MPHSIRLQLIYKAWLLFLTYAVLQGGSPSSDERRAATTSTDRANLPRVTDGAGNQLASRKRDLDDSDALLFFFLVVVVGCSIENFADVRMCEVGVLIAKGILHRPRRPWLSRFMRRSRIQQPKQGIRLPYLQGRFARTNRDGPSQQDTLEVACTSQRIWLGFFVRRTKRRQQRLSMEHDGNNKVWNQLIILVGCSISRQK